MIVFIDSDSRVARNAIRRIAQYFVYPEVGAVSGIVDVDNKKVNILTKMQTVRYFVAFDVVKAAEARFGAVTCCSGAFSAYRREAAEQVLSEWLAQSFLGTKSTYGDDRSLTNHVIKYRWSVLYAPDARAKTMVPETMKQFLRQQLRWKKSWIRESLAASKFMWKGHPINSALFYSSIFLTFMAPHVILRVIFVRSLSFGSFRTTTSSASSRCRWCTPSITGCTGPIHSGSTASYSRSSTQGYWCGSFRLPLPTSLIPGGGTRAC